jgi:hypothetical protein
MVFARNAIASGPGKARNSIVLEPTWVKVKVGKIRPSSFGGLKAPVVLKVGLIFIIISRKERIPGKALQMKIFISHIQEEFQVALVLKKWIESAFADHCQVLTSTDPEGIPSAAQTLEENERAWEETKALILLCSPDSLQKPWISFEAGCAWLRRILIIPVCYSGLSAGQLPQPLAIFPGFDLNQRDFGQNLFMTLAKELGISQLPDIQYRQMRQEVQQVLDAILPDVSPSSKEAGDAPLEPIHLQVLAVLKESYGFTSAVLAQHFNLEEKEVLPLLKRLIDGNYVYASPAGMGHVRYNLAKKGKDYLLESGLR